MCYKVFTTLKIFKFHMYKYHPGIKPFHCTACSRQFTYRFIFQRHLSNECVGGKHFQLKPDEVKELENRKCIVCKKVFKNVEVLKWHMRTYHNGVKPFPCITCKRKFLLRRSLQVHLEQNSTCLKSLNSGEILHTYNEKVHKTQNVGSGICVDCNITFENINDLRAHMYINHRKSESTKPTKECDENLTCPICTSMFKNTESVEVHMYRYHRDIRPFKCSTCGRGFRMRRPYQRHVESVQNCAKKEQNKMKFVDPADCYCVLCKKRWSTVQSLKAHMYRTHRNVKPFSCPNCNEQFSLRWSLKRHIKKTHTKDELRDLSPIERGANFQISVINEAANQSDEIESYPDFVKEESISSEEHSSVMFRESNKQNEDLTVQKHSLLSKFFIEEITDDMTARNTTELAQNLEDSDQPIENRICVICNSIYKTADSLKSHMHRMHKNVKPFKCSICGEEFTLRRGFTRHMLKREKCFSIKHSSQVEKNSDQKLENISMIESTNTSQYDIPINMTNNSIDKNDVEYRICQVCNKTFKNIASLKAHMHIQHKGIRPFSCRNCGKRFILKTTFLRHFNAQKCFKTKITLNNCS